MKYVYMIGFKNFHTGQIKKETIECGSVHKAKKIQQTLLEVYPVNVMNWFEPIILRKDK